MALCIPVLLLKRPHDSLGVAGTYFASSGLVLIDDSCGGSLLKAIDSGIGTTVAFLLVSPLILTLVRTGHTQRLPCKWLSWSMVLYSTLCAFLWGYVYSNFPQHRIVALNGMTTLAFFSMQPNTAPAAAPLTNVTTIPPTVAPVNFNMGWLPQNVSEAGSPAGDALADEQWGVQTFLSRVFAGVSSLPVKTYKDGYVAQVIKCCLGRFAGLFVGSMVCIFILPRRAEYTLLNRLRKSLEKIELIMVPLIALDSGIVEDRAVFESLVDRDLSIESHGLEFDDFMDIKAKIWKEVEDVYNLLQPGALLLVAAQFEHYIPQIYIGRRSRPHTVVPNTQKMHFPLSRWSAFTDWLKYDAIRLRITMTSFSCATYQECKTAVLALFFDVVSLYLTLETSEAVLNDGINEHDHLAWGTTIRVGNDITTIAKNKNPNINKYLTEPHIKFFEPRDPSSSEHIPESVVPNSRGFLFSGLRLGHTPRANIYARHTGVSWDDLDNRRKCIIQKGRTLVKVRPVASTPHLRKLVSNEEQDSCGPEQNFLPVDKDEERVNLSEAKTPVARSVYDLSSLEIADLISKTTTLAPSGAFSKEQHWVKPLLKWTDDFGPCIGKISRNIAAYINSLSESIDLGHPTVAVNLELSNVRKSVREMCFQRRIWQNRTEAMLQINLEAICSPDSVLDEDPAFVREVLEQILGISLTEFAHMTVSERGLLWSNLGYVRDKMARFMSVIVVLMIQLHRCRGPILSLLAVRA